MRKAHLVFASTSLALGLAALLAPRATGVRSEPPIVVVTAPPLGAVRDPRPATSVVGLWSRYESKGDNDPLRFYYFHDGGIGLYRYGKVAFNTTNSFDYTVADGVLSLTFRKTGAHHEVRYRIEHDGADASRDWLVLEGDPREPAPVRYFRTRGSLDASLSESVTGPLLASGFAHCTRARDDDKPAAALGDDVGDRLWIDARAYATGGMGFALYQLKGQAIDGRGVGWHHVGDFDDWSTEALTYRVNDAQLEIAFTLRNERATSSFHIEGQGEERQLVMAEDPRGFWHEHRFHDAGPSF